MNLWREEERARCQDSRVRYNGGREGGREAKKREWEGRRECLSTSIYPPDQEQEHVT